MSVSGGILHSFDSAFLLPDTTVSGMSTVLQYKLVPPIGQVDYKVSYRVKWRNCVGRCVFFVFCIKLYGGIYNLLLKYWHYLVRC